MTFLNSIQIKMIQISSVSGTQEVIKVTFSNSFYLKMVKHDKISFRRFKQFLRKKNLEKKDFSNLIQLAMIKRDKFTFLRILAVFGTRI